MIDEPDLDRPLGAWLINTTGFAVSFAVDTSLMEIEE